MEERPILFEDLKAAVEKGGDIKLAPLQERAANSSELLKAVQKDVFAQRQAAWDQFQRLDGAAQVIEYLLSLQQKPVE